jgi:hypothetical protein
MTDDRVAVPSLIARRRFLAQSAVAGAAALALPTVTRADEPTRTDDSLPADLHTKSALTLSEFARADSAVNVKDYGAKGDGVSDDTAAIRAAYVAAKGRTIFVPAGTYIFSTIVVTGGVQLNLRGESYVSTILQTTTARNIAVDFSGNVEGSSIRSITLQGTPANLGGIALGSAANYNAFTRLSDLVISGFSGVGAYGLSLNSVQELDVDNVILRLNYNNVYRPKSGFCTSTRFHGVAGYIGRAANVGVLLNGRCTDIGFQDVVFEGNRREALLSKGPASQIMMVGCYSEDNMRDGPSAGTGVISVTGQAASDGAKLRLLNHHFFLNPGNPSGKNLYLDKVRAAAVTDCYGLESNGGVETTENTSCLFRNNLSVAGGGSWVTALQKLPGVIIGDEFEVLQSPAYSVDRVLTHIGARKFTDRVKLTSLNVAGLTNSPKGLSAGDVWNNGGILTVVSGSSSR